MPDEQSTRPSLAPNATDIPTYFPHSNILNDSGIGAMPQAARELARALGTSADVAAKAEFADIEMANEFLEANPKATEEDVVKVMGGRNKIAHRLLRQNVGRLETQQVVLGIEGEIRESAVGGEGPEAVGKFYDEKINEHFGKDDRVSDSDWRSGAVSVSRNARARIVEESVLRDHDNLIGRQKQQLSTAFRKEIAHGMPRALEMMNTMLAGGETAGLTSEDELNHVVSEAVNWARLEDNLDEGADGLELLLEDPNYSADPQRQNMITSAIRDVLSRDAERQRESRREEKAAKAEAVDIYSLRLYDEINSATGRANPETWQGLIGSAGQEKADEIAWQYRAHRGSAPVSLSMTPLQELQIADRVRNGDMTVTEILAGNYPIGLKEKVSAQAQEGTPKHYSASHEYKFGVDTLKRSFPTDPSIVGGGGGPILFAAAVDAFDASMAALQASDPSILQPANAIKFAAARDMMVLQIREDLKNGVDVRAGALGDRKAAGAQQQERRTEFRERSRQEIIQEEVYDRASPQAQGSTDSDINVMYNAYRGTDPEIQQMWHDDVQYLIDRKNKKKD